MSEDGDLHFSDESLAFVTKGLRAAMGELKEFGTATGSLQGSGVAGLALSKMEAGHSGLADDFEGFCERWEWGVRALVQDASALAERLGLAAGMVWEEDQYRAGTFKVGLNSLVGNPHATEDEVTAQSWGDIVTPDAPDWSAESFEQARGEMAQTWKDTGRSLATEGRGGMLNDFAMDRAGVSGELREQALDQVFGPSPEERAQQAAAQPQPPQPQQQPQQPQPQGGD